MTPLPVPSLPDRLRLYALLHPESAELLREAADRIDMADAIYASTVESFPVAAAARLRDLAATMDNRLNREQTYTGAEIAAMLRGDGA